MNYYDTLILKAFIIYSLKFPDLFFTIIDSDAILPSSLLQEIFFNSLNSSNVVLQMKNKYR